MRPYINLMELPFARGGAGSSLFLGLTSVVGLIGGAYLLQCGAQHLLGKIAEKKSSNRKEETNEDIICIVCCADLDLSQAKNYETCCTCDKYICRGLKCANWRPKEAKWECQLCHNSKESLAQTSSWVAEQMSFNQHKFVYPMRARSEVYIPITHTQGDGQDSTMHLESVSQIGAHIMNLDERAKIREYVEEIVAEMLGGSLEHIKVGQLSKSENYLPAIVNGNSNNLNNNNNEQIGNNTGLNISQTHLRSLIETIIAETLRSSTSLNGVSGAVSEISLDTRSNAELSQDHGNNIGLKRRHRTEHYFEPKIYQDLLATAVLNKITDKEGNTRLISESTPDLSGHTIDENYNAEALSTTSGSSIEPRSDCSLTDHELTGKADSPLSLQAALERESVLSDYIAAHMVPLPDFSASVTESEDDIGSVSSSMIGDATWEDNWLFKKKRSSLQSSATPSSIGMLVPAPKENVRAQIGDKTADEISDLSEMGSDAEESSLDLLRGNALNDRLLNQHLIGGQNTKLVLDELVDRTSLISHTLPEENEPLITETTNTLVQLKPTEPLLFQDATPSEDLTQAPIADQLSSDSNRSDESEPSTALETFNGDDGDLVEESVSEGVEETHYTNHTNTNTTKTNLTINLTRRTNGKLTNGSLRWSNRSGAAASALPTGGAVNDDDHDDDDVVLLRRFVPGSIAEREVKKWYNAVEMPNNPYAPEALKQRISGTQERYMDVPNISPSAEQKALALMANATTEDPPTPQTDYKRYSRDYYINNADTLPSPSGKSHSSTDHEEQDIVINETKNAAEPPQQDTVYKALPAQVDETACSLDTLHSLQTNTTTTSDDSDTVRVYDFNKQETTVIKASALVEEPSGSATTSSMESAQSATPSTSSAMDSSVCKKRERPVVLQFGPGDSAPTIGSPMSTPTRGSTPPAFRFLQPKRRLIEPSQILSIDHQDEEDDVVPELNTPVAEKPVIEDDIKHAMPSVKALAQAFLLTSKHTQPQRRWRSTRVKLAVPPDTADKPSSSLTRKHKLEHGVSMAEVADECTISSDLSSLETDPSIISEGHSVNPPIASASPVPVRHGFLRSNIAFFENLKFK